MRNEIGNTYGRLTVLSFDHKRKGHVYYKCACECGGVVVTEAGNLRAGKTQSCGCLRRELSTQQHTTHGHADNERLYDIWIGIRQRCSNGGYKLFKWYGGKGVKLCDEWNDYSAFRAWAYANGYKDPNPGQTKGDAMSIDRIDPSDNYRPGNCRWVSLRENVSHMRVSKPIRGEGLSKTDPVSYTHLA